MISVIYLSLKDLDPKNLEAQVLTLKETSIKIHELNLDDGIYLIRVLHFSLNTLIDFSKSKDYQLLYFARNKKFIGAGYAINNADGDFLIQTQAKWAMIVPFEISWHQDLLNKIEKLKFAS